MFKVGSKIGSQWVHKEKHIASNKRNIYYRVLERNSHAKTRNVINKTKKLEYTRWIAAFL
jgi:hypothetical protein